MNTPGLIDSNYRGELKAIAINLDPKTPIEIRKGDRIAQLIIIKAEEVDFTEVDELSETERGAAVLVQVVISYLLHLLILYINLIIYLM